MTMSSTGLTARPPGQTPGMKGASAGPGQASTASTGMISESGNTRRVNRPPAAAPFSPRTAARADARMDGTRPLRRQPTGRNRSGMPLRL